MIMPAPSLPPDWEEALRDDLSRVGFEELLARITAERENGDVFPPPEETFTAFHHAPFAATRVVVLGQDPYHGPGQAHGLAFSVKPGVKAPPSLMNIYRELRDDLGCTIPDHGCLTKWAEQGVLLLNTVLTVRSGEPNSHKGLGWEAMTDSVISALSQRSAHVVFVLWGNHAKKKAKLIDARHTIVEGAHPSPLSVKQFMGSRPFSKINDALRKHDQREVDWQLPNGGTPT